MDTVWAALTIVLIDLVLSGDNAIVIGMAAHRLEPAQRRTAIVLGGAAAIVLRVTLTVVAVELLRVPALESIGGLVLLWIAVRLLAEEEEAHEGIKAGASLRQAVVTILVADFVMSLDNVLAVAAASHGSLRLLLFGLMLSMGILLFMGSLVAQLIDRFWWLSYAGSGVIAYTAARMVFEDRLVEHRLHLVSWPMHGAALVVAVATLAFAHWFHRIRGASTVAEIPRPEA